MAESLICTSGHVTEFIIIIIIIKQHQKSL